MITLLQPMHHDPSDQTIQSDEPNSPSDSLHSQMETAENQDCATTQPDYTASEIAPAVMYNSSETCQNQNNIDGMNDCFQQDSDNLISSTDVQPVADNIGNQGMADSGNADNLNLFGDPSESKDGLSDCNHNKYYDTADQYHTFPELQSLYNDHSIHHNFDPNNPQGYVIGNPGYEMQFWHKQSFNDCDIVAQQMGLESLTAKHFSESALLQEAIHDGSHLSTGGASDNYIGHLYETHGFPIERHHDGTLNELKNKLSDGQKIIVAVNSDILWANESAIPEFNHLSANHTVEVIGIVYPNDENGQPEVVLNDPGIDNGKGVMIPLEQFEKSWATSDHLIASAHHPDQHPTVLSDNQAPSQIAGSAGLGDGNRAIYNNDNEDQIAAKKYANQYEQNLKQQRAAEEERKHQLRMEQQEAQRREDIRREEQRREEMRREEQQQNQHN
jgi:hypothetical protein